MRQKREADDSQVIARLAELGEPPLQRGGRPAGAAFLGQAVSLAEARHTGWNVILKVERNAR